MPPTSCILFISSGFFDGSGGFRSVEESSLYGRFVISCGNVAHLVSRIEPTDENKTLWWGLVIQPLGSLYRASRNLGTFNSATLRASSEAGVGYWSQLLHQSGVDVLALDLDPPPRSKQGALVHGSGLSWEESAWMQMMQMMYLWGPGDLGLVFRREW